MIGESMPGAGSLGPGWAVWTGGAHTVDPEVRPSASTPGSPRILTPHAQSPQGPSREAPAGSVSADGLLANQLVAEEILAKESLAKERVAKESLATEPSSRELPGIETPAVELAGLQARTDALVRENELLRQRLALADRQVEVKDMQINDFKAITENLTRQNQVLLMLAQGVPMERILKGGQDIDVRPRESRRERTGSRRAASARPAQSGKGGREKAAPARADRAQLAEVLRGLVHSGASHRLIAESLNRDGAPTLSGTGAWDRRKVGKAVALLLRD